MRAAFQKKKSALLPQQKALLSAFVLRQVVEGHIDDQQAGTLLRSSVGLQWTLLTAVQYLTGKVAATALATLPDDYVHEGLTKAQLVEMLLLASYTAANVSPGGGPLTAGFLVDYFKAENLRLIRR